MSRKFVIFVEIQIYMKIIGIYKITSPTNRVYIGQSVDIEDRWKDYKCLDCKSQTALYNSFMKYGVDNHTFEIISRCYEEQLNEFERDFQEAYDVINTGLNCYLTKTNDRSGKLSEATKLKMSISATGIRHSEETKQKLSLIVIEYFKTNPHPNAKKVINTETGEIHPSCAFVARILKINQGWLSSMLNGTRKNKTIYKYL